MLKISENNGTEEIGLVTPTPGYVVLTSMWIDYHRLVCCCHTRPTTHSNTLRPRQNAHHFADDTFNRIFLKENVIISIRISLKFVPKSPIDNIPALFQIMAWRRPTQAEIRVVPPKIELIWAALLHFLATETCFEILFSYDFPLCPLKRWYIIITAMSEFIVVKERSANRCFFGLRNKALNTCFVIYLKFHSNERCLW